MPILLRGWNLTCFGCGYIVDNVFDAGHRAIPEEKVSTLIVPWGQEENQREKVIV